MSSQKRDRENLIETNEVAKVWIQELEDKIKEKNDYILWLSNEYKKIYVDGLKLCQMI